MIRPAAALLFSLAVSALPAQTFESHWRDGRAEMDGYRLTIERYGEARVGEAVMIFVTEPFSQSERVKADDPQANPAETFEALKLNFVRDFQTGVYDYNTMTSVFVRADDLTPSKITFTSAEWCGHVYEELIFHPNQVGAAIFSYFQGESAVESLDRPARGLTEDNLFILLRGLRGDFLDAGESVEVPLLPGALHRRLRHLPLEWTTAEIARRAEPETIEVPAGAFECMVYEVRVADGRTGVFHIESAYPHRIVRYDWGHERAELLGSERMAYWQLNGEGDESRLGEFGLSAD